MIENKVLTVSGMKCGGCEANITAKLSVIPGVYSVIADHKASTVTLQYDEAHIQLESLIKVITDAGFTAN